MEGNLINMSDIEIGDEIVISCHSDLKYLKVLKIPKDRKTGYFKVSRRLDVITHGSFSYKKKHI